MNPTDRSRRHPGAILAALLLCQGCGAPDEPSEPVSPGTAATAPGATPGEPVRAPELKRSVVAEMLPYAEVDASLVYGHFAFPSDMIDPLPAVILVHDRFGLTDAMRSLADRMAAEGYIVLAVDLFGGKTASDPSTARAFQVQVLENMDLASDNLRQAHAFVDETAGAPAVGALGFGFGGGLALNAAMLLPDQMDAVVIYYGQVSTDEQKLEPVEAPILGLFASNDRSVPAGDIAAFEAVLAELGKRHSVHVYPDTRNAFADPSSENYDPATAEDAWLRSTAFLAGTLSAAGVPNASR